MQFPVMTSYEMRDSRLIAKTPVKKWFESEGKPEIYVAFEKIVDIKSLIRFVQYYGLPGVDATQFFGIKKLTDLPDKMMGYMLGWNYPLDDQIELIYEEARKMRRIHLLVARQQKISVNLEMPIPARKMNPYLTSYYDFENEEFPQSNNEALGIIDDVFTDYFRLRQELLFWDGHRFTIVMKYKRLIDAIWHEFFKAITNKILETKQCPECGMLQEMSKTSIQKYCHDGMTKASACNSRVKSRRDMFKKQQKRKILALLNKNQKDNSV